jgi:NAD(P)-dependent dehydrogenase (short-subunit alcohol dehydrogenase family)
MSLAIDLSGRRAVVTGAGKGIGREICLELARAGAAVCAVSRTESDLKSLGEEIEALGARYGYCVAGVGGPVEAERIASVAEEALGGVNLLVNNAGVSYPAPAEAVTEVEWDAMFDTNVKGAFFLSQAIGKRMLARGGGRIINVTSQAGLVALQDHAAYCASKAALGMITKLLAVEWGPHGITVNAVAPTVILTPMGERVWGDPEKARPMLAKIPIGRFGRPPEVSAVVAFLASDMASLMNGEVLALDGGYTAQ